MTSLQRVPRLRPMLAAAFAAATLGIATGNGVVLLSVVVPVAFVVYDGLTTAPHPDVEVERSVSGVVTPGETMEVELLVRNVGDSTLPDLRVVDGVPDGVRVVDGLPSTYTALRPGESARVQYEVVAGRGVHEFEPVVVRSRSVSGSTEWEVEADAASVVSCGPGLEEFPVLREPVEFGGRVETDRGGGGIEFYSTRRYQPSDPVNQVDWRRYAKTGELMAVEFRAQRGSTAVVVVDARRNYAAGGVRESYFELVSYAALEALSVLAGYGNRVGLAVLHGDSLYWMEPRGNTDHVQGIQYVLSGFQEKASEGVLDEGLWGEVITGGDELLRGELLARLPPSTNVVYFSSLLGGSADETVEDLGQHAHHVSVLSPQVVRGESSGARLARLRRRGMVEDLRLGGVDVVDWDPDEPIEVAVERDLEVSGE